MKLLIVCIISFAVVYNKIKVPASVYNPIHQTIDINASTPSVTIYFNSTVPITCPCSMTIQVHSSNVKKSTCSIAFNALDAPGTNHTLKISPYKTAGSYSPVGQLSFDPITLPNSFWNGYTIKKIPVSSFTNVFYE